MMQPHHKAKIEQQTREEFPNGIPAFGTDALRFTFAALASTGRDVNFDLQRTEGYRNFCNKIWNAARYVLMNTQGQDCGSDGEVTLSAADRWIRSRLQHTTATMRRALDHYRFDHAAQAIHEFFWDEYCSWYLELSKPVLNDNHTSHAAQRGTRQTLVQVLEQALRLLHPIMPFITEEIWQQIKAPAGKDGETIMLQPYPEEDAGARDQDAEDEMQWVRQFIQGIRRIKGEMNIAPGKPVPVLLAHADQQDMARAETHRPYLDFLAKTESVTVLPEGDHGPESATALVGKMNVLIPLAGLMVKDAELARLDKQIGKLESDLEKSRQKLQNPNFVEKAPEAVVKKEKQRVEEMRAALTNLQDQRLAIVNL